MEDLNAETEKFMGMIKGDTGEIDAATAKLESYRKEIENLKDSSSALASTLADTQQELDNANRDKQVYKTNIENVAAGNGYFDENGEYHAYERKETSGASNASDRDTA
jgi:chromosome segregation ATPase